MYSIAARGFYKLQKMRRQGLLNNDPNAEALVDEITHTLDTKNDATLESILQLSNSSDSSNKQDKKKKKHRHKKKERTDTIFNLLEQPTLLKEKTFFRDDSLGHKRYRKLRKKVDPANLLRNAQKDSCSAPETAVKSGQKRSSPASSGLAHSKSPLSTKRQRASGILPESFNLKTEEIVESDSRESTPDLILDESDDATDSDWELDDPVSLGKEEFLTMIYPVSAADFFENYFEQRPLYVERNIPPCDDWITVQDIDLILRKSQVMFGEHLDLTCYRNGQQHWFNSPGRAFRSVVWDHYNTGCSIRLSCPQLFFKSIRYRIGVLQEYFGCLVGANLYITPPGAQGFAPHYDDFDAFILQLEGSKKWLVYKPRIPSEVLPREPSKNLSEDSLEEPLMTATLNVGDMLYLPRGFIHQGSTPEDTHSLHVTVSFYQKHTWGDFLLKVVPCALRCAMETNAEYRQGLPVRFLRHVGGFATYTGIPSALENGDESTKCVKEVRREVAQRLRQLADFIENPTRVDQSVPPTDVDMRCEPPDPLLIAADDMAVDLINRSFPPQLSTDENYCHAQKQGERWAPRRFTVNSVPLRGDGGVADVVELEPHTKIRLVRWSAVRLARTRVSTLTQNNTEIGHDSNEKKDAVVVALYHSLSNPYLFKGEEADQLSVGIEHVPAFDYLVKAFPRFVAIQDLPLPTLGDQMNFAIGLYDAGLVLTHCPLPTTNDVSSSDDDQVDYSTGSDEETSNSESNYEVDLDTGTDSDLLEVASMEGLHDSVTEDEDGRQNVEKATSASGKKEAGKENSGDEETLEFRTDVGGINDDDGGGGGGGDTTDKLVERLSSSSSDSKRRKTFAAPPAAKGAADRKRSKSVEFKKKKKKKKHPKSARH